MKTPEATRRGHQEPQHVTTLLSLPPFARLPASRPGHHSPVNTATFLQGSSPGGTSDQAGPGSVSELGGIPFAFLGLIFLIRLGPEIFTVSFQVLISIILNFPTIIPSVLYLKRVLYFPYKLFLPYSYCPK